MNDWNEQIFEMIGRLRQNGLNKSNSRSRAASAPVIQTPCQMIVSDNPDRIKTKSKAASVSVTDSRVNKVKVIADFINSKLY